MNVSVILSTYNSPLWLEKVLWGYSCQTFRDFHLIIADDGSKDETGRLIDRMREETGLSLERVWQRDKGFRKCRILNKAVLAAPDGYIIFSDGDCIPRRDFVAVHAHRAAPGHYLSGGYFKLPLSTSHEITREHIVTGECFDVRWLRRHGLGYWRKTGKLTATAATARWLNRFTPVKCNFKGSNASAWKTDILAVNGFDERMPWGGEDREFGVRLINSGIKPRHVRYDAIVLHLDHERGYVDPEKVADNKRLRMHTQRSGSCRTDHGIAQHQSGQAQAGGGIRKETA